MRVHVEHDSVLRLVKVWILDDTPGGVFRVVPGERDWLMERVEEGVMPEPSLVVGEAFWAAFVEAIHPPRRVDDVVVSVLEREQDRVDKLIDTITRP